LMNNSLSDMPIGVVYLGSSLKVRSGESIMCELAAPLRGMGFGFNLRPLLWKVMLFWGFIAESMFLPA
jgi:hypothetical protein